MSSLWIVIGLLSLVACAAMAATLIWTPRRGTDRRAEFDLTVYKDQLAEVERDVERGVLTETQAVAARTEIERRILALAGEANAAGSDSGQSGRSGGQSAAALAIAVAVPSAALAMYLHLGAPMVPNAPYASRNIAGEQAAAAESRRTGEMTALTERLAARLASEPGNVQGWMLLGRSYASLNRDADAVRAMKRAYELEPLDPAVLVQYAETLIIANKNIVSEQAAAILQRALSQDQRNPRARYYLALAKAQSGDVRGALQDWTDLAAISPEGAPWLPSVDQQITAAARDAGIDPATLKPSLEAIALGQPTAAPALPGPSRTEVEAASRMAPKDRTEMIRGMVQRLADRLEQNPDDPDGWRRLADAYRVLGEDEKAAQAEARAKTAAAPAASPAAPGPSAADMEAAAGLSDADRSQMIRGMVQRLADRLEENPDDIDGWRRLARAYKVLGDTAKAAEAEARVKALQP